MREIAEKIGKSKTTVRYWMEKHNIPRRSGSEAAYYAYWGPEKRLSELQEKVTVEKVKNLYYEKGYSARLVGESLRRSESSIYGFMERHDLPRRSPADTNKLAYIRQKPSFSIKGNLSQEGEKLKTAGIMLYWAEGVKLNLKTRSMSVDFSNSDPRMIKLFLKFLRRICGVDEKRLRVLLYCYADQDIEALKKYWQRVIKIPPAQFTKPYVRKDFLPEKSGKMKYGLIHVRYADKKLLLQIEKWIKKYLKENEIN